MLFGAQEWRTEAHPRLPEKICHHIYSETTELVKTGRPRARNGENKSAKIQKMLIFRPYPRYIRTEDRPAQRTPLLTQEILIPWGLTLRAAPPHSNDTVNPQGRDFRSPAAIQDPMPAARTPAPAASCLRYGQVATQPTTVLFLKQPFSTILDLKCLTSSVLLRIAIRSSRIENRGSPAAP